MTIEEWLHKATGQLTQADISTARLDCLVLLEDAIERDRSWILAHPEHTLTTADASVLHAKLERRSKHEPLAYIRGFTEFFGRTFAIDRRVLEPRSESETMIELLKALPLPEKPVIIDVGTGSGALAITAKLEIPGAKVLGVDIDQDCIDVAAMNAKQLGADITLRIGNLLTPLPREQFDRSILLCNLPYVPDNFQINLAAMNEPRRAIFGGADGLDLYRQLFAYLHHSAIEPLFVLTESLPPQHKVLAELARRDGFVLEQAEDFIQVFKMAVGNSAS